MISRRELFTAGAAGTIASEYSESASAVGQSREEIDMLRDIARRINGVESALERAAFSNEVVFGLAAKVREHMEVFFRTNQKFPDFIDVGYHVFMDTYDWHIKNRQQMVVTRGVDGRYWMQFMFTTLILRAEQDPKYIGIPYDKG